MKNIPTWIAVGQDFDCESDAHKQEAFACEFHDFNLPRFDLWLLSLPDCELRTEMLERRKLATEALRANNHEVAARHLECMHMSQLYDKREQFLLPLAQRDKKRQDGTRKERRPAITEWIEKKLSSNPAAKSPNLWADAPEWFTDEIEYERFSKRVTRARKAKKDASN